MISMPWGSLPPLYVPHLIEKALHDGAILTVSISGGVDSQALLWSLAAYCAERGYRNQITAVSADLGRFEWPDAHQHIVWMCEQAGAPLTIVRRTNGDLLDRIDQRQATILASDKPDRPFWPSSTERYCTSDLKRGPINTHIRAQRKRGVIIDAEGIRADESETRAEREPLSIRTGPTNQVLTKFSPEDAYALRGEQHRLVLTWYPLHAWTKGDCYHACGTTLEELEQRRALYRQGQKTTAFDGWPCARSYVRGASRHSCAICVLASRHDIQVGAREHPELAKEIIARETASGWTFKKDMRLADLAQTLA